MRIKCSSRGTGGLNLSGPTYSALCKCLDLLVMPCMLTQEGFIYNQDKSKKD